ncbi:MAG: methionine adenosyltransferase [bacterium]|nr:methionine adenosyltransferase [bacterium]
MSDAKKNYLFSSESVTEGHPDKICDQISDAVLDEIFRQEIESGDVEAAHCACETFTTTGMILVGGEIRTNAIINVDQIVREVVDSIGYNDADFGFDCNTCAVISTLHGQSPDIAQGVDEAYDVQQATKDGSDKYDLTGAGDQGIMFGYACNETKTLMPMPIYLAHRLAEKLTEVRKNGTLTYLRPDGKTQVTVKYEDDKPVGVTTVLISSQHADGIDIQGQMKPDFIEHIIKPVFEAEGVEFNDDIEVLVNPTGRFVVGGPMGDSGLTGRKIIVDTYGGMGRHGGGAFSGKDCTKVDRSAAYAARWIAKNIVAAGIAEKCEVQLAYAIGVARPLSVFVDAFGTSKYSQEQLAAAVNKVFDLRPGAIIDTLQLRRPIYRLTTNYGHFGRELPEFTWEKTDRVDELLAALAE